MSESSEMYLLTIAMLEENQHDSMIPLPLLAEELNVQPVSANQMVRKLEEEGLVEYEPYKGVVLTPTGRVNARRILRHRRLWEVFLVRHLHIPADEAEHLACGVEHITTPIIAQRLAVFLEQPSHCPHGRPIPQEEGGHTYLPSRPLTQLEVGQSGTITALSGPQAAQTYCQAHRLSPGTQVTIQAVSPQAWLLQTPDGWLSLGADLATQIQIQPDPVHHAA
jgi:DtxR family Mn-dependent transcriptional regulator